MRKSEGKWIDGSGAVAKYHIQARCNSSIKEMSCYYINKFCGDGSEPKTTIMTAKPKVDKETGEVMPPKQTEVVLYSYTYSMAWERLSNGLGLISRNDQLLIQLVEQLSALAIKVKPISPLSDEDHKTLRATLDGWMILLRQYYLWLNKGSKPVRIWDVIPGCDKYMLQAAMSRLCHGRQFRIKIKDLKAELAVIKSMYEEYKKEYETRKNLDMKTPESWLKKLGWLSFSAHWNIRVDASSRYNDPGISETIRDTLEWIVDVPDKGTPDLIQFFNIDIESIKRYLQEARNYKTKREHSDEEMELMADKFKTLVSNLCTASKEIYPQGVDNERCQLPFTRLTSYPTF
ncbi:MAG: hypothetical protein IJR53_06600 [Bacteroidales bacterium]|nr:hypothetical protein [Bacteroidales bacterium]